MTDISTTDELFDYLKDKSIIHGELHDDGLHMTLSDGRILMIVGSFVVGVLDEGTTLQ